MTLQSDITINASAFSPASISPETHAFNEKLMNMMSKAPKWWEVGAPKYRQMRAAGETPLPKSTLLDSAESFSIPSRDPGRSIPCRILKPQTNHPLTGVFMHIHGGGWVLQDETTQDPYLQTLASATGLLAISIGYRLSPEHPFPCGPEDCIDAASWLIDHAPSRFGTALAFLGGESAGAHLSVLTALHLLQHGESARHSAFRLRGLLLHFGCYDLTLTPQVYHFRKPAPLILDSEIIHHFLEAFLPGTTMEQRKHPAISPLYADLAAVEELPAALFTCGTEDPLLDDTVFMSAKWMAGGGEAVVRILAGAPHAYIGFPGEVLGVAREGMDVTVEFMKSRLE